MSCDAIEYDPGGNLCEFLRFYLVQASAVYSTFRNQLRGRDPLKRFEDTRVKLRMFLQSLEEGALRVKHEIDVVCCRLGTVPYETEWVLAFA